MSYTCITDALGTADCFRQLVVVNVMPLPFLISLITLTAMTVERYMSVIQGRTFEINLGGVLCSGTDFCSICVW